MTGERQIRWIYERCGRVVGGLFRSRFLFLAKLLFLSSFLSFGQQTAYSSYCRGSSRFFIVVVAVVVALNGAKELSVGHLNAKKEAA